VPLLVRCAGGRGGSDIAVSRLCWPRQPPCLHGCVALSRGRESRVSGVVAVLTVAMLTLANCAPRRPDFTARVEQDCAAGDKWACHLIDALRHPRQGGRL